MGDSYVARLSDQLIDSGLLSVIDMDSARAVCEQAGIRLPAALSRLGLVADVDIAEALAALHSLPTVTGSEISAERVHIDDINNEFLLRQSVLPLSLTDGVLSLAMGDPDDAEALQAVAFAAGAHEVRPVVAAFSDIEEALGRGSEGAVSPGLAPGRVMAFDLEQLSESTSDAPVVRVVHRLLTDAVNRAASDVHFEPMARHLSVRYRLDGRLVEIERYPDGLAGPIASRIKVMAGLDIAETRLPQDGRLRLTVRGREVDVRVSTSPTAHGESLVLRLLGRSAVPLDLGSLGLPAHALGALERALERPHGMILLTGPTGSGKSTTLYSAINRLKRPEVKILTVEDPVEIMIEGVNQVQVRPEINLTYAAALRAFLRQDPDILMIGEIRDLETAEIALRAALTGHLVLTTLHTNSALGAFDRLTDIGIEPYLAASTVIATIAQRLVRSLCENCRRERHVSSDEAMLFERAGLPPPLSLFDPGGCPKCANTGYRGRIPLIEIVEVDEKVRDAVRAGTAGDLETGRPPRETLVGHGLSLVRDGRTTLREIQRAVQVI